MRPPAVVFAVLAVVLAVLPRAPARAEDPAPERFHLGSHSWKVTTAVPEAQKAFDRGLTLAYAFAHEAAEEAFREAARLDPSCAMAWWGVALVNGPHINFPLVPPDRAKEAWEALGKARGLAGKASERERLLVDALGTRYADPQPEDRAPLDRAYADAMREVSKAHPGDADVATLFAEALMDLRPWDLWKPDGRPQPGTAEVLSTLERALAANPGHPGANHLWIHALEASPEPARATAAADVLRDLVPGAGHLVHMPSHVYARIGRWADAAESNRRAIEADAAFRAARPKVGFYALYMAHNHHFLAFTAMMRGRRAEAVAAARATVDGIPEEFLRDYGFLADGFLAFVPEVLMRFGRWEEVLAEPPPRGGLPLSTALWRYTRAASANALGRVEEAERERAAFREAAARVGPEVIFGNATGKDLLEIATRVLDGEFLAREERFPEAVALLEQAVALEDGLRYDEPPDWIQPVRHTLGAVLLRADRPADAAPVYEVDLARYPENGWSLFGLGRALRLRGMDAEASAVEARFREAWKDADTKITNTCLCQPGK